MPLEETANMLLMIAAIAKRRGNSTGFIAAKFWPLLATWNAYLVATAKAPALQGCTDDFMGALANNTNLALKGILAIGAYAQLRAMQGDAAGARNYTAISKDYAAFWMTHADDGDHYRMAYGETLTPRPRPRLPASSRETRPLLRATCGGNNPRPRIRSQIRLYF